jgi:hypothetical protein
MRRLSFRVAVLFLAFVAGIASARLFHKLYIQFECTAIGEIIVEPGGSGGFSAFKSYDGVELGFWQAGFPSREAAAAAFQRSLAGAVKVVEREPLYDSKRENVVGERVVAIFPPNERVQSEWVSVTYLDDKMLYQIMSVSLRHALAFDKGNHRR